MVFTTSPYATWLWLLLYYSLGEIPLEVKELEDTGSGMELQGTVHGSPWVFPRTLTNSPEELVESFLPKWNEWPISTTSKEIKLLHPTQEVKQNKIIKAFVSLPLISLF